jgi:hypothetical protein
MLPGGALTDGAFLHSDCYFNSPIRAKIGTDKEPQQRQKGKLISTIHDTASLERAME